MKCFSLLITPCGLTSGCISTRAPSGDVSADAEIVAPAISANWTWEGRTDEELRRTFGEPKNVVAHEGYDVWVFSKGSQVMVGLSSEAKAKAEIIACGFAMQEEEWRFFVKDGRVAKWMAARYVNGKEIPFEKW